MSEQSDDIRNRPFPKRASEVRPTEESYTFPDGTICTLTLTTYGWRIEHPRGVGSAGTLERARKVKDSFLREVCTEMSEKARGIIK